MRMCASTLQLTGYRVDVNIFAQVGNKGFAKCLRRQQQGQVIGDGLTALEALGMFHLLLLLLLLLLSLLGAACSARQCYADAGGA
jgi:hypothetical protein